MASLKSCPSLAAAVRSCCVAARRSQHLGPIVTEQRPVSDGPLTFCMRIITSLKEKDKARKTQTDSDNPFLPPEPQMLVGELTEHYNLVLNKFPVLENHVLLTTKAFEDQGSELTARDFKAVALMFRSDLDGIAFYNCGDESGRSQNHKHLQYIPFPLCEDTDEVTSIDDLLERQGGRAKFQQPSRIEVLPYDHSIITFRDELHDADSLLNAYQALARSLNWFHRNSYNWICTKNWMMLVPRRQENAHKVSLNALAYIFHVLVRSEEQAAACEDFGLINLLKEGAFATAEEHSDHQ